MTGIGRDRTIVLETTNYQDMIECLEVVGLPKMVKDDVQEDTGCSISRERGAEIGQETIKHVVT